MLAADCGTIWTKVKNFASGQTSIINTQELLKNNSHKFNWATGHLGRAVCSNYENELVTLCAGSLAVVDEPDFTVVDIGGRDIKYCGFKNRNLIRMNWNQSCGATTGFILDMLSKFYNLDYNTLQAADEILQATCGVLGIENVFDEIIKGATTHNAVARLVLGFAYNIYNFAEKPQKLYISGGLCENKCFIDSISKFTNIKLLGRFVLAEGLRAHIYPSSISSPVVGIGDVVRRYDIDA